MNYLNAVNRVLRLLREPEISSLSQGDVVSDIVAEYINDAKRTVEDTHNWNALRYDWTSVISAGTQEFELTGSGRLPMIENVYGTDGVELKERTNQELRRMQYATGQATGTYPMYYAVSGRTAANDVKVRVHPAPVADYTVDTWGYKKTVDLALDSDEILVPTKPVIYLAYALAARERGEVGGQTASEIFGVAGQYLKDAVAQDAALNTLEYNWYS